MNDLILQMKNFGRAMKPYVLLIYEIVLESKPDYVLEIGTGQCQSARSILCALKENNKGKLYSVDVRDRSRRINDELKPFFTQIVGNSHNQETLDMIPKENYDILLIDGDHSYGGVKKDFEMYVPLVKEGGLILMHDILNNDKHCGVPKFWEEIKYPKVALKYGVAQNNIRVGMGLVEKI